MENTRSRLVILENQELLSDPKAHKKHYLAVELHHGSREDLLKHLPPKEHGKVHASHITLNFSPSKEEFEHFVKNNHGKDTDVDVTHEAHDPQIGAHAARVTGSEVEKFSKPHKHVTISTREGVGPKFSNDVLSSQEGEALKNPLKLKGTFRAIPKG